MDSKIWSRLPLEIIGTIILLTSNTVTRKVWYDATEFNSTLHGFACRGYFRDLCLHYKDLAASPKEVKELDAARDLASQGIFEGIAKPGELEKARKDRLEKAWVTNEIAQEIYCHNSTDQASILNRISGGGRYKHSILPPAAFVRRLSLDFFADIDGDWRRPVTEESSMRFASLPTDKTLSHSLRVLFRNLSNVQTILVAGILPQELLNRITSTPSSKLTELILRRIGRSVFQGPEHTSFNRRRMLRHGLDFSELGYLQHLQRLEIYCVNKKEATSLASIINTLSCLRSLTLSSLSPYSSNSSRMEGGGPNPFIEDFFETILPLAARTQLPIWHSSWPDPPLNQKLPGLPPKLESLTLVDYSRRRHTAISPAMAGLELLCPALSQLYLAVFEQDTVSRFLAWMSLPRLQKLTVALMPYQREPNWSSFGVFLQQVVSAYSELLELKILHGSNVPYSIINLLRSDILFFPEDLVLRVEPDPLGVAPDLDLPQIRNLFTSNIALNGSGAPLYESLSPQVQRLRVHGPATAYGDVSTVLQSSYRIYIRVLVLLLQSQQTTQQSGDPIDEVFDPASLNEPSVTPESAPSPCPRLTQELALAAKIAENILSLTLIRIGEYIFWIDRIDPVVFEGKRFKVWHLAQVQEYSSQKEKMAKELNDLDWKFLNEEDPVVPPAKEDILSFEYDPGRPIESPTWANNHYIVFRRELSSQGT